MRVAKKTYFFCLLICLFVVIFDQASKFAVLAFIPKGQTIEICPCLNLLLTFNYGTSFGLLSPKTLAEFYLIVAISILCILFLIYVFFKIKSTAEQMLCALLIGGAVGNLLDRFIHGAVVDFIDVYYQNWHWPAFNVADCFISCSAILLVLFNLFSRER